MIATGVNEVNAGTGVPSATRNTDGQTRVAVQGRTNLRVRVSTAGSGTITIASNISVREGLVTLASPLPPGVNALGSVLADLRVAGALNASGNPIFAQITNFPASQTVSGTVTLGAGSAQIGTIGNTAFGISGTLPAYAATPTFNVGTTGGLALDVTLTGRLGTLGQKNSAGSAPVVIASDQSAISVSVGNFPASQAVTNAGTFAVQNTAAVVGGNATAVKTDGSATTQPISASALPLPTGAATDANINARLGTLGQKTASGSAPVVLPSDQAPIPITIRAAGTNRSASVTTTASTLMAANTARQGWKVKNDCTVAVVINFDATATNAAGSGNFLIPAGGYMSSEPGFVETGAMSVIAASGTCALTAREH